MSKKKNATTNYPLGSHKKFCERCYKHHGKCPITRKKPTKSCKL